MTNNERAIAYIRLNWMDRQDIVELLENDSIQCYDSDLLDDLKEAVMQNLDDGTFTLDMLPESGTDTENRRLKELYNNGN